MRPDVGTNPSVTVTIRVRPWARALLSRRSCMAMAMLAAVSPAAAAWVVDRIAALVATHGMEVT